MTDTARELLERTKERIRLTREYVGEDVLPAIDGWEWYEATKEIDAYLATPEEDVDSVWETVYLWQDRANKAEAVLQEAAEALDAIKQRAGRSMDEGDNSWLAQNVYAKASDVLPRLREAGGE